MTQAELDQKTDAAIGKYANKKVADPSGNYVGQCVSKQKREFADITGKAAPATGTGYADGWLTRPGIFKDYFNPAETYNPSKDYPKGSWVFNKGTHHVATYLNRQGSGARVFEQNADPDGSPAHISVRPGNRISHVMTWKVSTPAPSKAPAATGMPKVGQTIHLSKGVTRTTFNSKGQQVGSIHASDDTYDYLVRGINGNRVVINSKSGGGDGVEVALFYLAGGRIDGWSIK